ncbi:MAG: aminoglycoside phosphotransferase family protein [Chloroflexota bacterium]
MIKKSLLTEAVISQSISQNYGFESSKIDFLPLGYDPYSANYRLESDDGVYFLKAYQRFQKASIDVPLYLKASGFGHDLVPIQTLSGSYSYQVGGIIVVLFPFMEQKEEETNLSSAQWYQMGRLLRQIHDTPLSQHISQIIPNEDYKKQPTVQQIVQQYLQTIADTSPTSDEHQALINLWTQHHDSLSRLLDKFEIVRQQLAQQTPSLVLCHGDFHPWNILMPPSDKWLVIDWDDVRLAPPESDMMFFLGHLIEDVFLAGYGGLVPDKQIIAYYTHLWTLQEIQEYSELIIDNKDDEDQPLRQEALREIKHYIHTHH